LVAIIALLNRAVDRLWRQADNVRLVLDTEPAGVIAVDARGRIVLVNREAEQQFGYRRDELIGQPVELLVPESLRQQHAAFREAFLAQPEARAMGAGRDLQGRRKDGSVVPIEVGLNPIERDGVTGALATIVDISERQAAERRQTILVQEVRHRAGNLLAIVQAVARQTIPKEASRDFLAALASLARTQDLFLGSTVGTLAQIIELELAAFRERVQVEGCDVTLTPRAGQDLVLIVHELATNAIKYGALSVATGTVRVSGRAENGRLTFVWQEQGAPAVAPTALQPGFGQTILQDLARSFCDEVNVAFEPPGLRYTLTVDLRRISKVVGLAS
jgi:PAS domain S-box-containing protein